MMKFTQAELHTISCALSIAAGVFDDDAATAMADGHPRIAAQFDRQAREARQLAYDIDNRPEEA